MSIHIPIVMYGLRLFIVELHCQINMPGLQISLSSQSFLSPVFEIRALKLKQNNNDEKMKMNFTVLMPFLQSKFCHVFEDPHILPLRTLS